MNESLTEQYLTNLRKKLSGDRNRPGFHFISPGNWINDPHGLIEWEGQVHLFYQYNPNGPFHGTIHWGHAVSDDWVYWHDLPVALEPGPEPYDQDGIWTGCLIDDNGSPTIFYTATFPQTVAAAVGSPDLVTWKKLPENPLIDGPPPEIGRLAGGHFRDPFIWKEENGWYMLMASKIETQGGQILLYHSDDLRRWAYRGIFLGGDATINEPFWQGTMWECPNLLDDGDRQLLILSVQAAHSSLLYPVYFSGRRQGDRFIPEQSAILVHGASFYAPQAIRLSDGRFLMIGWLQEERSQQACQEAGWNGAHSLPLILTVLPDGDVAVSPIEQLHKLRGDHWQEGPITLSAPTEQVLPQVRGRSLEIKTELQPGEGAECGIIVFSSPDGQEQTTIVYKQEEGQIFVEREHSSLDQRADRNPATMPISLAPGEALELHIFLDHSIIEIFVQGRLYLACRVYPTREDSQSLRLFTRKGNATFTYIKVWQMKAIWPNSKH